MGRGAFQGPSRIGRSNGGGGGRRGGEGGKEEGGGPTHRHTAHTKQSGW